MNSRERVILALNHKEPDRVPIDIGGSAATSLLIPAYNNLKKYLNIETKTRLFNKFFHTAAVEEVVSKKLNVDIILIYSEEIEKFKDDEYKDDSFTDEWGVRALRLKNSLYYSFNKHPLSEASTNEDIINFKFPNYLNNNNLVILREKIHHLFNETNFAIVGEIGDSIFERAWYLRGLENILNDMFFNKKLLHVLFNKLADYFIAKSEKFLNVVGDYIQVFFIADDLGTQNGPLISLDMYREFLKPYHTKLYGFIKNKTEAKLIIHSCGSIYDYLPDLIEIGVDGINPVQTNAFKMDARRLKKDFGKDLSFWGGMDTQKVLPFGREDDIKNEIIEKIENLAPGGGYILGPVHNIQPDISPEKIIKMTDYGRKFGTY